MAIIDKILDIAFQHSYTLKPGFIVENFGKKNVRNVFLSETAIAEIELAILSKVGKSFLYCYGKNFGYNYAKIIELPSAVPIVRDEIMKSLMTFFETTYGHCEKYSVDWDSRKFEIHGDNIIVCRKNGVGLLMFLGPWAGLLAQLTKDKTVNGLKASCQGRGESNCTGLFGPGLGEFKEAVTIPDRILDDEYFVMNKLIPFQQDYGLTILREVGLVKYQQNTFDINGERFFPVEVGFIHLLEFELSEKGLDLENLIYLPVFAAFEKFGRENLKQKYRSVFAAFDFTSKLFSALGWGICQIKADGSSGLLVRGLPYTSSLKNVKKSYYLQGALDGLVSGLTGTKVKSKIDSISFESNCSLSFSFSKVI